MKKSQIRTIAIFIGGLVTITAYQNCSKVQFEDAPVATPLSLKFEEAIDKTCALGIKNSVPLSSLELHCKNFDAPDYANGRWIENGFAAYLFPKKVDALKTVPDSCLQGFEVGNLYKESITIKSYSPSGTKSDLALEVDLATYGAPDGSRIIAKDAAGKETIVFDSCNIRTSCYGDPTNGNKRPYEDSIRSFNVAVPKGTVALTLDHTNALTPTYIRILGICEFDLSQLPATKEVFSNVQVTQFQLVQSRAISSMGLTSPETVINQY